MDILETNMHSADQLKGAPAWQLSLPDPGQAGEVPGGERRDGPGRCAGPEQLDPGAECFNGEGFLKSAVTGTSEGERRESITTQPARRRQTTFRPP